MFKKRPGPPPKPIPVETVEKVVKTAHSYPWYGYKKIAVICRKNPIRVTNRQVYRIMKKYRLLQKRKPYRAEIYQATKLWELLPDCPNGLWQMDVTYVHIPGYGWWYVITIIDYYSRYLLAAHLGSTYSASEITKVLEMAKSEAEGIHGRLLSTPFLVTDNGPSFLAKRFHQFVKDQYSHIRIQYRTPTQLGLLERFHQTLKEEEVYYHLYENPGEARESIEIGR